MFENILFATDSSKLANGGVAWGIDLAKSQSANLTAVAVTELWRMHDIVEETHKGNPDPFADYEKAAAETAEKRLAAVMADAEKVGVACDTIHIPDKHPAEGILSAAREAGADLIVIASHGSRGLQKLVLGSVAAEVANESDIPVLIVK